MKEEQDGRCMICSIAFEINVARENHWFEWNVFNFEHVPSREFEWIRSRRGRTRLGDLSASATLGEAAGAGPPNAVGSSASMSLSSHFKPHPSRNRTSRGIISIRCLAASSLTGALATYFSYSDLYTRTMSGGKLTGISTSSPSCFLAVGSH